MYNGMRIQHTMIVMHENVWLVPSRLSECCLPLSSGVSRKSPPEGRVAALAIRLEN